MTCTGVVVGIGGVVTTGGGVVTMGVGVVDGVGTIGVEEVVGVVGVVLMDGEPVEGVVVVTLVILCVVMSRKSALRAGMIDCSCVEGMYLEW